jgi:lysophospholipase L1-like esterase
MALSALQYAALKATLRAKIAGYDYRDSPPFPSTVQPVLWIDGRQTAYSDASGATVASAFTGRVRRIGYRSPAIGNAQAVSDPLRPWRETAALSFEVGAGNYLNAPVAADCSQQAVTLAVAFTLRDKPEGSPQVLLANGTQLGLWAFSANIPSLSYNNTAGFWQPNPAAKWALGAPNAAIFRLSAGQIKATLIIDGVRADYSTSVAVDPSTLALANWFVGWDGVDANDYRLHGAISQAIAVPRAISDAENDQLATWLAANPTPRYCPTEVPVVTVCGDSIARAGYLFFGVPLSQSYLMIAQQTLNATQPVNLINGAISGDSIASQQTSVFGPILLPFYSPSRARNVFFQAAGTNNMAALSQDGPTTLALSYALMDAAKAAGFRVVGYTILPRIGTGHDAAFETARQYYNTHMLAEYAARGYSAVADCGAIALLQNPANATYYSDGIHPTVAGHALMAPVVAAALQAAIT